MSETAKHTPTPWICDDKDPDDLFRYVLAESRPVQPICKIDLVVKSLYHPAAKQRAENEANAAFIVEAVNSHAKLTAERDALRAACAAVVASNEGRQSLITATSMCYAALAATPEAGEVGK